MEKLPEEKGIDFKVKADTSPDAIVVLAGDKGQIVCCNRKLLDLSGFTKEEIIGHSFIEFIHPRVQTRLHYNYRQRIADNPPPEQYESRIITRDGRILPVEIRGQKITWEGRPADWISLRLLVDLQKPERDQRELEKRLNTWKRRQLEDQVQAQSQLLDSVIEGIATDALGNIIFVSQQAVRMTGWDREQLLGCQVFTFFPPEFQSQAVELQKLLKRGSDYAGEVPVICADGRIKRFLVHLKPIVQGGQMTCVIGITASPVEPGGPETHFAQSEKSEQMAGSGQNGRTSPDLIQIENQFLDLKEQVERISRALTRNESLSLQPESGPGRLIKHIQPPIETHPASALRLEVYCLGQFKVCSPHKQLQQWQSGRAKEVLEFLISRRPAAVTREMLMEALWPEHTPATAANNLRTAVYNLRQTLNALLDLDAAFNSVIFSQGEYLINPEFELIIDTGEFETCFNQARRLEQTGRTEAAMQEYCQAEEMYRGDYLENELYQDWTLNRREALKDTYLLILNKLADYAMNSQDYESCILYSQKTLARDACREDVCRRLMCCYSRLGQRNRAVQWYQTFRQTVKAELHTALDQKTIELFNRLNNGQEI
jgi:PAS domain S-box-containing protein